MEEGIAALYDQRGIEGVRPRFAYPLIRLAHTGPLTIKELAESLELTHSAVSQTVSALRAQGLVDTAPGPDARTRVVGLTESGRELVPFLEAEWRATEAAAAELDAALPVSLVEFTDALREHLADRPFLDRILDHLPDADHVPDKDHRPDTDHLHDTVHLPDTDHP
nr:MarR family transcriptional regulator [Ornithinimicrobium sp. F0845]